MTRLFTTSVMVAVVGTSIFIAAQQSSTSSTHIPAAVLAAALKEAGDVPVIDANVRTVQAGPDQVFINITRRTQRGMPTDSAAAHKTVSEVYYVVEGAGTLVTGGTLTNPSDQANDTGGNVRGTGIQNGERRRISVGDVVVIPAGTPHTFSDIEGTLVYLDVRINPTSR